jgi:hypothetical protein
VEVSGLRDAGGAIHATRVRGAPGLDHVSLEGEVAGPVAGSFMIGPIEIVYDGSTDLVDVPAAGLVAGDFVDVRGVLLDPDTVDAGAPAPNNVIELEARAISGSRGDVQLDGIVSAFASVSDFELGGQPVNAGRFAVEFEPATLFTDLAVGDRIEVEGSVVDGVLVAEAVKLRAGEVRIEAQVGDPVSVVDTEAGTLELLGGATLEVDGATRFADPADALFDDLGDLAEDDLLDVRGIDLGAAVRPTEINRIAALDDVRVRGRMDSFDGGSGTFAIVGVEIAADAETSYEGFPSAIDTPAEFFALLSACPGALLDVTAAAVPDGLALAVADAIALEESCTP